MIYKKKKKKVFQEANVWLEDTRKSIVESDGHTDPRIRTHSGDKCSPEPMCVAEPYCILVHCPKIVKNSGEVPNQMQSSLKKSQIGCFSYINQGQLLGSDNRIYFCLYDRLGDLGKWHAISHCGRLSEHFCHPPECQHYP